MALIVADRIKEASTSTGTGPATLSGAIAGFRAFSSVCSINDTCHYTIQAIDASGAPTGEWEVGLGTYSSSNTLTRTTVYSSSNGGSAVDFSAGTKQVWMDIPARAFAPYTPPANWTPTISGGTSAGTTTYNAQYGRVTKIGKLVMLQFRVGWTAQSGSGVLTLGNLPYPIANVTGGDHVGTVMSDSLTFGGSTLVAYAVPNSTNVNFYGSSNNAGWSAVNVDPTGTMIGTIMYETSTP